MIEPQQEKNNQHTRNSIDAPQFLAWIEYSLRICFKVKHARLSLSLSVICLEFTWYFLSLFFSYAIRLGQSPLTHTHSPYHMNLFT